MKPTLFVINPAAGAGKTKLLIPKLKTWISDSGIAAKISLSTLTYSIKDIVKNEFTNDFEALVIVGGDGTLNEAVNGLQIFDKPIGIIQTGTGNDFYKALGKSISLKKQFDIAINAACKPIDIALCNDTRLVNGVGIGFDGFVAKKANALKQKGKGKGMAYYWVIISTLFSYKSIKIQYQLDTSKVQEQEVLLLTVGNGTSFGGGFKLTPNALLDDGLLDVCLIKRVGIVQRLLRLPFIPFGKHVNMKVVKYQTAKEIQIKSDDFFDAHIDGESLRVDQLKIQLMDEKLMLRVPQ